MIVPSDSKIKLIIFDLDGTLLDTLTDLALSTNHALEQNGFPEHPVESYKLFVGNGIDKLIERVLPPDSRESEMQRQVKSDFLNHYSVHLNDHTVPYPGVSELLSELEKRRIQIAVATNKPQEPARSIMSEKFATTTFDAVLGQVTKRAVKPNPEIVFEIIKKSGVKASETLYVGDSDVDMQTAHNAGVTGIGCLWGFRSERELKENGATHLIRHPLELLDHLNPSCPH